MNAATLVPIDSIGIAAGYQNCRNIYRAGHVTLTGLMSDRLDNFNGGGQEIRQACTYDNVTNNN